jgi:hypothetical protein
MGVQKLCIIALRSHASFSPVAQAAADREKREFCQGESERRNRIKHFANMQTSGPAASGGR